jgi:thiamine-phosphate pyrophosphorylase
MVRTPEALGARWIAGLYALTPECSDAGAMTERVAAALDGGAATIQYRNKTAAPAVRLQEALALRALCASRGATFIVNDDIDLALAVDADGVHLGRDDATIATARTRLHARALIGASCYGSLERAEAAVGAGADYIAFGSFFPSNTKPGAVRAELSVLSTAKARWKVPIVAIGGITPGNAGTLIDAGADAVAVISGLFDAPDVAAAARSFVALFNDRDKRKEHSHAAR